MLEDFDTANAMLFTIEAFHMTVRFKVFESVLPILAGPKYWEKLFDEVPAFASELKRRCLIAVSQSRGRAGLWAQIGVVTLWYWEGD